MSFLKSILDIRSLPNILFAIISFHSVGCLFILLMISFAVQKLFILIYSHLVIFTFVAFAFGGCQIQKVITKTGVKELIACVFLWEFCG